jgi:hypothetical protein
MKSIIIFTFLGLFLIINCTKEKIVNSNEESQEFVSVQVDFQSGTEENRICLKFNDETYFDAMLSNLLPLTGPVAGFTTCLPIGQNKLYILSQYLGVAAIISNEDSTIIDFGNADKYYIGIELSDDRYQFTVQENPFQYQ